MPVPTDITAGTISISGSTVTGVGTSFEASDIRQGDLFIWIEGGAGQWSPIVQTVTSNTVLTLAEPWTGPTISGARYRLRYQWDSSRVSAQSRQLIEMLDNGNVLALAGLTGPGVPVFDGPHSMTIRPEADFINGVAYDVQVDTLADRAAYDGQAAGYSVLVSDVGDGRSAVYSKASNTNGDWTDPAYITGPVGPLVTLDAGTTTTLPPGSDATFDVVPVTGGYELNAGIPAGEGFSFIPGGYNPATAYVKGDVVRNNNSSWIAVQATTGNAPPVLPVTSNAFWELLAAAGVNGTGTGDVVGPDSAVADRIAVFDGTTGKLIKDGGSTIAGLAPADGSISNTKLANVPTATIKGRAAAGTGVPTDLTAAQVLTLVQGAGGYGRSNILGTVSQSAGTPTGAIIERGSNANGQYVRYADGTQICFGYNLPGSGTFPSAFLGNPSTVCSAEIAPGDVANGVAVTSFVTSITPTGFTLILRYVVAGDVGPSGYQVSWTAIGRWF